MDFSSVVVNVSLSIFMIIGMMIFIVSNREVDGNTNKYFIIYIAVVCLLLIFDSWEYYLSSLPRLDNMRYFTTAMCYTLRVTAITVMNLLMHSNKQNLVILWLPAIVVTIFTFTNPYTHWICCFSEKNGFHGDPIRFLPHIMLGICLLILTVETVIKQRKYKNHVNILFAFAIIINIFATVIETMFYVKFMLTGTMMVSCLLYYSIINKQN